MAAGAVGVVTPEVLDAVVPKPACLLVPLVILGLRKIDPLLAVRVGAGCWTATLAPVALMEMSEWLPMLSGEEF